MIKQDFVNQSHWDHAYELVGPTPAGSNDPIRMLLERNLPKGGLRSIELGCYPGRYLTVLGEMGHILNGYDLTPKVAELPYWFSKLGFNTGRFEQQDVFRLDESKQYDVVTSFGLIEHFGNWRELFIKHIEMVAPGGYLVITTPNFKSLLQHTLHMVVDNENLGRHNLDSMCPKVWAQIAADAGFEVIFCGGVGRFEFWADAQKRNIIQRIVLKIIMTTKPLWRFAPQGTLSLSPYYGIVARRAPYP